MPHNDPVLNVLAKELYMATDMLKQQDKYVILEARLLEKVRSPLNAPANGNMVRTIHENVACRAFYRFRKGEFTVFSFTTDRASFEYELSK